MRPPELDCLFEPLDIGPVRTRNRFYQVPHCNGMGRAFPSAMAGMREVKAEGGWGVVSTEQCDIHHSSAHRRELRLWDRQDVPYLANAVTGIHRHGALAAIELAHNGFHVANLESRVVPLAPTGRPTRGVFPVHARTMTRRDIVDLRRWYRRAAENAVTAGFDIVYVYAGHDMTTPGFFLSREHNRRTDEYGGSLQNRVRLLREIIEETKDVAGDRAAVALRFGVDALPAPEGPDREEPRAVVEMLAELPDLWDVNLQSFAEDGQTSRFGPSGAQEDAVRFVKSVTSKPVVGVGRFTSPDMMARMIRHGVLDLVGAARPSIADPFLPAKTEAGRLDEIRECIGCNICVAGDKAGVPMRCTQNPTMGEEWRRGWHPEFVPSRSTGDSFLVVGAGPAGLEAARTLGQRGYDVLLVDADTELGGRSRRECRLPGLGEWARVHEWRLGRIRAMRNVVPAPANRITADDALAADVTSIVLATGARWRADGIGRYRSTPITGPADPAAGPRICTPDDLMDGDVPDGDVLLFDDDHYYMGSEPFST
ncbi:oxidoreductase [Pseudonocardia sp. HH130630-07]|uniref:oxidoreductase n=1 Tax=Pseudonocardia sp. HH130630-07 TaxID=1690815 RepID=UPI000814EFFC|nr:NAD(P)-binding protein [Pseudonocardia sp. HH130630-07]ANY08058.1 hypothetical protein AFB00_19150 [Pseudonocardia sp. HH130630-07]